MSGMAIRCGDAQGRGRVLTPAIAAVAAAALAGGMLLAGARPAAAATCPAATAITVTFCDTGAAQTWTVPAGMTQATFTLYGADGGAGAGTAGAGGDGAEVTGTLPVTPGTVLQVDVGVAGAEGTGGFGGGGTSSGGSGGGGASYVISPASGGTYPFANALLVAAGGGGGGGAGSGAQNAQPDGGAGGNAGAVAPGGPGGDGASADGDCGETITGGYGGSGGTATTGGGGGAAGSLANCKVDVAGTPGGNGSQGAGGGGSSALGGGGGGGWYGGGGGGGSPVDGGNADGGGGGGGGGSSYTGAATNPSAGVDSGTTPNDGASGEVIISYPLTVTTSGLPNGTAGSAYSQTLTAANGTSPIIWSLTIGSLPAGLSLSSDGTISGTPAGAGSATFTVQAEDSSSPAQTASATLTLKIFPAPLMIATTSLDSATAGSPYSQQLSATGGTSPYSWSLASGTLPAGLSLSTAGVISGTPTQPGTSSFTVQAADSGDPQLTASAGLSVTVSQAAPEIDLSASPTSGPTLDTPVTLTMTAVGVAGLATPTGTATFTVNGSAASCGSAGTVSITAGSAACSLGDLAAGTYSFGASYSGDTDYLPDQASLSGYLVSQVSQTVTFTTSTPSTADYGGSYVPAAAGGGSGNPVTFAASGACTMSADGSTVEFTGTGTCTVTASQAGNSGYLAGQAQQSFTVAPSATKTAVSVTPTALSATVTATPPGGGIPSGTVIFLVNGTAVGIAELNAAGEATLSYSSSVPETAAAQYGGTPDYLASSGSTTTANPVITAAVSSTSPVSAYGWYSAPVTVTFTCTPASAPLTAPCPSPVTLSSNGADQVVSETINATDGGIATASVTVSIDQTSPVISVSGIKNGANYDAPGPATITCAATESLSGLAGACTLTVKRTETAISWTATATSKAGVTATAAGSASLTDFYVSGAKLVNGRFLVTDGKAFTLVAYVLSTTTAPRYVDATPAGTKPHKTGPAMQKTGPHLWALKVTITTKMKGKTASWTAGVLVGHTLYTVPLTLQR